jgi:phosphopantetheinyl transferase (holo-ACP synthase)/malonyl CoA-acyl carrier protein transacylase
MSELVIVRAEDTAALVSEMTRIAAYLDRVPAASLLDVAYTCSKMKGKSVIAFVADSIQDLRIRLGSASSRIGGGSLKRLRDKSGTYWNGTHLLGDGGGKLAFVYPSVMSFYPDMMSDLAIRSESCRSAFEELEEAVVQEGGEFTPSSFIFPPAPYYRHDADIFSSGAYAQALVATYAGSTAMSRLLAQCGLKPEGVVGFAGGDLSSVIGAGMGGRELSRHERIRFLREIYDIVDKAVDHAGLPKMAVVSLLLRHETEADEVLASFPKGKVLLAIDLSPRQKAYAIACDFVETAMTAFAASGVRAMKLALDRPFNTAMCERLVPVIRKFADRWIRHDPVCPVYSCASATSMVGRLKKVRAELAERWAQPVLFGETVRHMHADGYRVFLEVGPRGLMTTAVDDALKDVEHAALATNSIHRRGIPQVQHALAQLAALGAEMDVSGSLARRGARTLDFDSTFVVATRREIEMKLSRAFPRLTLLSDETMLSGSSAFAEPKGRGAKAAARAAAVAAQARRMRQFDFGALNPLVSDADTLNHSPGVSIELKKRFTIKDAPFIGDFALGGTQLSYAEPSLRGLVQMSMPLAAEIMAETAAMLVPNRTLVAIEDLTSRRSVAFEDGALTVLIRAERVAANNPELSAVKVQMRDDSPGSAYTWPVMEATFVLAKATPEPKPVSVIPQFKPRTVHWSGRDIYPSRLSCGHRLRGITFAETWSEVGIDYEVEVPQLAGSVSHTRFPLWLVNPLLLEIIVSGYSLWHSHERFSRWIGKERMDDAYSSPFRMRRLDLLAPLPKEGSKIKCYLRLTGVTPKSHLCDITVSDGDGGALAVISGWEERVEHVRREYRDLIMQPATSFITQPVSPSQLGNPTLDVSSAFVTDVPYPVFERDDEVWLQTFSHIVLGAKERKDFRRMPGSAARRTEWLFGRIAVKEAVRRFLKDYYQARWSDADVTIFADDMGKPYAVGAWMDQLPVKLDIAIAHTSQFVIGLAAANARIGVDVESVSRDLSQEFTDGVFMPDELELAAGAANASLAIIRFWCAKEAVSKALGTGIRYSPKEMTVSGYEPDTGKLTMRLNGAWGEAFRSLKGRDLPVTVRTMHDHALAFCFLPASIFADES